MSEPQVQRCEVLQPPGGWPELHVLAVAHPPSADPAAGREAARQRVRALLRRHAGADIAAPFMAAARSAPGAGRASVSHAASHSLLAWCAHGCVGIDIVGAQQLADSSPQALAATAALYLGPDTAARIGSAADASHARRLFADAWARHEASLKCLGLTLAEWSPARQACLATCSTAAVSAPSHGLVLAPGWVIRIAWRVPVDRASMLQP